MKIHWNFIKNKAFSSALFLLFGAGFAHGQTAVKVTLLNNAEQNYSVETTGKLWFSSNDLIINTDDALTPTTIPLASIRKITFEGNGNTTGVNEVVKNKENISIFPNPADNYFTLQTTDATNLNVRIYNTNGVQVASGTYQSGSKIDVSHFTAGIYVVVVNNQSFKLIKQ